MVRLQIFRSPLFAVFKQCHQETLKLNYTLVFTNDLYIDEIHPDLLKIHGGLVDLFYLICRQHLWRDLHVQVRHWLGGGFIFSPRKLGKWSNLRSIFFRWVGSTTNMYGFHSSPTSVLIKCNMVCRTWPFLTHWTELFGWSCNHQT